MGTVGVEQALGLPVEQRAEALLALKEDQWFDRKSGRISASDLADHQIGLANAEGGTLVLGLHRGVVEGIDSIAARENDWRQAPLDFTFPPVPSRFRTIECITSNGHPDRLAVIEVETSDKVHANAADEVFLRVGDENRRLNFGQRQELMYDKGQANFEATAARDATTRDLDPDLLGAYADAVRAQDQTQLLHARGLLTRAGEPTVGAVLLFGSDPQSYFPAAHVRILRYRGTQRGFGAHQQLIDDVRCEGSIPEVLMEAEAAIMRIMPTRRALASSGRFERVGIIPHDAWLEGLVNAVVHRSYSISGDHIRFEIFDDRVEVESPGRFPGLVDPNDIESVRRFARNPRVARVCADLHFGQELGEGVKRIFEEMRLAGLAEPIYFQTSGSVRLTLYSAPVDRHLEERLPEGARHILRVLRETQRAGTGELVNSTGRSRPLVISQLKSLQKAGLVEWVGNGPSDPRAFWRIKTEKATGA